MDHPIKSDGLEILMTPFMLVVLVLSAVALALLSFGALIYIALERDMNELEGDDSD